MTTPTEAKVSETTWLIYFEDVDHRPEIFGGADNAEAGARARLIDARWAWSCHLFVDAGTYDAQAAELKRARAENDRISSSFVVMQDDIAELLRALGLSDHARDASPHEVMTNEIIPAVKRARAVVEDVRRFWADSEDYATDEGRRTEAVVFKRHVNERLQKYEQGE